MENTDQQANKPTTTPQRLMSLDALRGFDMFWIVGGAGLVRTIAEMVSPAFHEWVLVQTEHPEWNGYTPWDQIFPMFMFIAGAAMPFSLTRRIERGESRAALHWRVIRRGLLLVLLGAIYNGLLRFEFADQRYPSVLGRIGLGYLFAGLIVLNTKVRGQAIATAVILIGYCLAMNLIPVPVYGAGDLTPGHTLSGYVDRHLIPGKLYKDVRDPEGLLSTIPAIATVLSGALAGHWLRRRSPSGVAKTVGLFLAGVACVFAGLIWSWWFPLNKNLWTSSFVLLTSGWSLILLSCFYLVIDVWGARRWAFFFVVIGMNAITAYLLNRFIDFGGIAHTVFGRAERAVHPAVFSALTLMLLWCLLFWLYRKKLFLRV